MNILRQIANIIRTEFNKLYNGTKGVQYSRSVGPNLAHSKTLAQIESDRTTALAELDARKADLFGGKIPTSQLPAIVFSETFPVNSELEMLGLTAQTGDVAIRLDESRSYILQGTDPAALSDWQELLTPIDAVQSVAGKTGVVTLQSADIMDLGSYAEFETAFTTGLL